MSCRHCRLRSRELCRRLTEYWAPIKTPWLERNELQRSVSAFAELQNVGALVNSLKPFAELGLRRFGFRLPLGEYGCPGVAPCPRTLFARSMTATSSGFSLPTKWQTCLLVDECTDPDGCEYVELPVGGILWSSPAIAVPLDPGDVEVKNADDGQKLPWGEGRIVGDVVECCVRLH